MNKTKRFSFGQGAGSFGAGAWRGLASMALGGLLLGLLAQKLQDVQMAQVQAALLAFTPQVWVVAGLATGLSFWAVGQYDDCVHRHLATGQHGTRARRAGLTAIALSQTVGFGPVSGALVRWRMLPDLSLWQATRITATVTVFFLFSWLAITSVVLSVLPGAPLADWAIFGVIATLCGGVICLIQPGPAFGRGAALLPNFFTLCRIKGWAVVDLGAACVALWMFLPEGVRFGTLLPAFLLAFGAGILSGAPAGVGAFEATLFATLPIGAEPVIAAILAWRMLHYALPACIAAIVAGFAPQPERRVDKLPSGAIPLRWAEAGLIRQGEFSLLRVGHGGLICGQTPHGSVVLRDPLGDVAHATALTALCAEAQARGKQPVLYKASARFAVAARQAGFSVLAVAAEAVLRPAEFDLGIPSRAGLRRKLRRAEKAGVRIVIADSRMRGRLGAVNAAWVARHGRERGFSMGRYEAGYLAGQTVFVALIGDQPVGFASFHRGCGEWALDLLRPSPDAPEGTAQALIVAAIRLAAQDGTRRFSLAAVSRIGSQRPGNGLSHLVSRLARDPRGKGLLQFKQGFAPDREPLYLCAPGPLAVLIAAADLYRAIHFPPGLSGKGRGASEYEIASDLGAWQRLGQP